MLDALRFIVEHLPQDVSGPSLLRYLDGLPIDDTGDSALSVCGLLGYPQEHPLDESSSLAVRQAILSSHSPWAALAGVAWLKGAANRDESGSGTAILETVIVELLARYEHGNRDEEGALRVWAILPPVMELASDDWSEVLEGYLWPRHHARIRLQAVSVLGHVIPHLSPAAQRARLMAIVSLGTDADDAVALAALETIHRCHPDSSEVLSDLAVALGERRALAGRARLLAGRPSPRDR